LNGTFEAVSNWPTWGYLVAEDKKSLSKALEGYVAKAQIGPSWTSKPFSSLNDLFQAHADFYQNYSRRLWEKVQPWFNQAMAKIAAAGP